MKVKNNWLIILLSLNLFACDNRVFHDEYINIHHEGQNTIEITEVVMDTIYIDASLTSLEGEWHLKGNKIYFVDLSLIGVKEFDLDGQYISSHVEKGRGPNEILQPIIASSFSDKGDFVALDRGWIVNLFNESFNKGKSYLLFEDLDDSKRDWDNLLKNPDPEEFLMYEFFISAKSIRFLNDQVIIPVITEHIDYNGFYKNSNTQNFWTESYNFLMINIKDRKIEKLFAHYPPIFREKNIPVFSLINFDTDNGLIYCSYGADSLIYIRNNNGELVKSIGYSAPSIKGEYPETMTFEDYSSNYRQHQKEYGYYKQVKVANNLLFRSYKKDGTTGYGLQIYKENNLIGDLNFKEDIHIIGYSEGFYYGVLPTDIELEQLRIVKFKL